LFHKVTFYAYYNTQLQIPPNYSKQYEEFLSYSKTTVTRREEYGRN